MKLLWAILMFLVYCSFIAVAGIPLTVSILATGAVCTFYTSLVRKFYMYVRLQAIFRSLSTAIEYLAIHITHILLTCAVLVVLDPFQLL